MITDGPSVQTNPSCTLDAGFEVIEVVLMFMQAL